MSDHPDDDHPDDEFDEGAVLHTGPDAEAVARAFSDGIPWRAEPPAAEEEAATIRVVRPAPDPEDAVIRFVRDRIEPGCTNPEKTARIAQRDAEAGESREAERQAAEEEANTAILHEIRRKAESRKAAEDAERARLKARPDPVGACALLMVSSVIDEAPDLEEIAKTRGSVIALLVPEKWRKPIAKAWRELVLSQDDEAEEGDWRRSREERAKAARYPFGVIADKDTVKRTDDSIGEALRSGRGVLVTTADMGHVPPALAATADRIVAFDPIAPEILREVAETVGIRTGSLIPAHVATAAEPDHMLAALRPGQHAEDWLQRLVDIIGAVGTKKSATSEKPRWTLDTLPLPDHVLAWGRQLVSDLNDFRDGRLKWADVDRGALVFGPPGTGKTTFAGALAASAGVPLIVGGYSSWETGGDGKSDYRFILQNMRKTFSEAKSKAPSIIFIDEIDSFIARGKAAHNEGYWRPIVNALLEQISGAVDREGVVVIAATNLRDEIDPALKRAGRLDRELRMQLPDEELLARILRAHLPGVDGLERAAAAAVGGSGADCEKWARGARRTARLEGRPVELGDLLAEIGERTETRPPAALRRAAYHEAGHALHTLLVAPGCLVRVTVRRTIGLNGSTMSTMPLDREQLPSDLDELMQHMLSGRAAEEVVFRIAGAGSGGGPDSDLARATLIAACAEASWGLGESLRWRGDPTAETLTSFLAVNKEIAQAVETRLAAALADARAFLRRNRRALDALADALIERETLTGAEAEAIVSSVTERPSLDLVRPGCV